MLFKIDDIHLNKNEYIEEKELHMKKLWGWDDAKGEIINGIYLEVGNRSPELGSKLQ